VPNRFRWALAGLAVNLGLSLMAAAAAPPAPADEPQLTLELVKTVPPNRMLSERAATTLLGVDGFPVPQQRAVLGQVLIFSSADVAVVLPRVLPGRSFHHGLPIQVYNQTSDNMKIRWQDSLFLDRRGNGTLAFEGMSVAHPKSEAPDRDNSLIEPSLVPAGLFFKGNVFPVRDFDYASGEVQFAPPTGQIGLYLVLDTGRSNRRTFSFLFKLSAAPGAGPGAKTEP